MNKLMTIQAKLKAPKNLFNKFGGYSYRNAEGICEAVKPLLEEMKCSLTLSDEIVLVGDRVYVKAIATLKDCETDTVIDSTTAFAREPEMKKGMDESQITGTASSYARKYALNGLFLLDDTKDADSEEHKIEKDAKGKIEDKKNLAELIGKIKLELIRTGVSEENACKRYNATTLNDLSLDNATKCLSGLLKTKDKE